MRARGQLINLRVNLSVDRDQVEPAVIVEIDEGHTPFHPGERSHRDSGVVGDVAEIVAALVEVKDVVFVSEVGDIERFESGVVVIAKGNAHRALLGTIGADGGAGLESDVGELAVTIVAIEILRSGVVGHVDVGAAFIVEVGPENTESVITARVVHSSLLRNLGESAVAVVVVQRIACAMESAWTALHVDTTIFAGRTASGSR